MMNAVLKGTASQSETKPSAIAYAVDIVGLSKCFRRRTLARGRYSTLKSTLLAWLKGTRASTESNTQTWAVNDLTMRVPRGASLGVIGRNGSGKSTLLKLISGIYKPSAGSVSVNGRVAALIELGAGFHPDFSGRENVMLGGVMLGLSRTEVEERFDAIVDFAELRDVIDDPVRTYSSGMFMRLGFSLAVHTDPDILIVDEVLAVGDAGFVSKCKERISELRRSGKTLFLVTHDLDAVERWCDEVVWLDQGVVQDRGDPRRVIDAYRQFVERGEERDLVEARSEKRDMTVTQPAAQAVSEPQRWGSREVEITAVRLQDGDSADRLLFHPESVVQISIDYRINEPTNDVVFGIGIHRNDGLPIHGSNTDLERIEFGALPPSGTVRYRINRLGLLEGNYLLDVAVHRRDGYPYDYHKHIVQFAARSPINHVGVVAFDHQWSIDSR